MAWLKHKKDEPLEIGIGDHDFSQFVQDTCRDPQRFKAVQSVFSRLKRASREKMIRGNLSGIKFGLGW